MLRKRHTTELRRTTSLVKKAFFDIVGNRIIGANVLDLYAGEGGFGIEALKRGAGYVVFVEISRKNASLINKKLYELRLHERATVHVVEVEKFLRHSEFLTDIIFADPPYESGEYDLLSKALLEFRGIKEDTIICIEHFHKHHLSENFGSFVLLKRYRYGDTILSFYRRQ